MEFTVFTASGGLREFVGDSTYEIGEHNGCLSVLDGSTGQTIVYGANGWSSVQERHFVEVEVSPAAGASSGSHQASEAELTEAQEVLATLDEPEAPRRRAEEEEDLASFFFESRR